MPSPNVEAAMELREEDRKAFLDLFPEKERSSVANLFLRQVREGVTEPSLIRRSVMTDALERLANAERWAGHNPSWADAGEKHRRVVDLIWEHHDLAIRYAAYCVAYESLPPDERSRVKVAHHAEGMKAAIENMPASDAQKKYLREGFNYRADVDALTKRQASELIDRFLKEKKDLRERSMGMG